MHLRLLLILSACLSVLACTQQDSADLVIRDAWIREAPPNATALAGYMMIENHSKKDLTLVGVSSPAFESIELHRSVHEQGVAKMMRQDAISIPARAKLTLKPGDYHLMLMGPTQRLRAGDEVTASLELDNGYSQTITLHVRKDQGGAHEHHH